MKKSLFVIVLSLITSNALAQNTFYESMLDGNAERRAAEVQPPSGVAVRTSDDYVDQNVEYVLNDANTKSYTVTGSVVLKSNGKSTTYCSFYKTFILGGQAQTFPCGDYLGAAYLTEINGKITLYRALYDDNSTRIDFDGTNVTQKPRDVLKGVTFKRPGEF